jgi:glycosyltransferase involved in cell wall biosynthesis
MMRIACYGYVYKDTGSVAGANFLILEELLKRGFEIDFFGWEGFNKPNELLEYPSFKFIDLPKSYIGSSIHENLPHFLKEKYKSILWPVIHVLFDAWIDQSHLEKTVTLQNQSQQYDALIFLGVCSSFKIPSVPTISWLQGTPQTEWKYIQRLRPQILQYGGLAFYLKAAIHYAFGAPRVQKEISYSDVLICESFWSRDRMLEYGIHPERLRVLPYPMDLELFQPAPTTSQNSNNGKKTFLWLGRIEPRKRFDLMMAAYGLLLQERQDVHLKVVGEFRHVPGYRKLMESFEQAGQLEYAPFVPRAEIPQLLHKCDVVVQASEAENFGSSIAEAMCCGLSVVLGASNGTKDFIGDGGVIFEEYTPEALKNAMFKAIESRDSDSSLVIKRNRTIAEQNFSVSKVVDQFVQILEKASELSRFASPQKTPLISRDVFLFRESIARASKHNF